MQQSAATRGEPEGGQPAANIPEDAVRASLDRILASPGFANADRLSRFLRYAVEETLAGRSHEVMFTPQIPAVRSFGPIVGH